jgi:hypothetical protein
MKYEDCGVLYQKITKNDIEQAYFGTLSLVDNFKVGQHKEMAILIDINNQEQFYLTQF